MPFLLVFLDVFAEVLTFVGMSAWLGLGWALLLMIGLMIGGSVLATAQLRRPRGTPVHQAATTGILMVAMLLSSLPGYLTSVVAMLLVFPPTRQALMNMLAKRIRTQMEDFGTKLYQHSPMANQQDFYGAFTDPEGAGPQDGGFPQSRFPQDGFSQPQGGQWYEVIDEEEIRQWTQDLSPEDFTKGSDGENGEGNSGKGKK